MDGISTINRPTWVPLVPAQAAARAKQRRWDIWGEQQRTGHDPCFSTERRIICEESACLWRAECLSLRAEWRR